MFQLHETKTSPVGEIVRKIAEAYAEETDQVCAKLLETPPMWPPRVRRLVEVLGNLRRHPLRLPVNWVARRTPMLRSFVKPIVRHPATSDTFNTQRDRHAASFAPLPPFSAASYGYEPHPRRVIYLLNNCRPYDSGGYAVRAHGIIKSLMAHGYEVIPLARPGYPYDTHSNVIDGPPAIEIDGVAYRFFPSGIANLRKMNRGAYAAIYARELRAFVEQERPAILHAASFHQNAHAALSVRESHGTPVVYEVRGLSILNEFSKSASDVAPLRQRMFPTPRRFWEFREEVEVSKRADHLLCITRAASDLFAACGVDRQRISLLPNGAMDEVAASPYVTPPPQPFTLGYIGSMQYYEGIEMLIEAVEALASRGAALRLLLVGGGPYGAEVQERVRKSTCRERIEVHPRVPHEEVDAHYTRCSAMVYPRLPLPICEVISPLKPFEPMARGIPVIASDVDALAEIVRHGENGYTFKAGDIADLIYRIKTLAAAGPEEVRTITDQAKRFIVEERRWTVLTEAVADLYRQLHWRARS